MNDKRIYEMRADICKAMAHPLRMEVIDLLKDKTLCFGDILKKTGGLKSNLSQHLAVMTGKGILDVRKEGQCNYYSLASDRITKACSMLQELLVDQIKREKKILEDLL